jgi:hypothetical protein
VTVPDHLTAEHADRAADIVRRALDAVGAKHVQVLTATSGVDLTLYRPITKPDEEPTP